VYHYKDTGNRDLNAGFSYYPRRNAGIAVGSAFIPIPGADVLAATGNIWTMYVRINKELELPFTDNFAKSVGVAVATNLGINVAALLMVAVLLKFIPIIGTAAGIAILGATIFGITVVAGIVYMNAISALLRQKPAEDISAEDAAEAARKAMANKKELKEMLKGAKKDYDPDKDYKSEV
jgi:uncharacterized protein (DUF697 family)